MIDIIVTDNHTRVFSEDGYIFLFEQSARVTLVTLAASAKPSVP